MKKFIGLDVGDVRIGVAKCDPLGILATALEVIDRTKTNPVERIKEILDDPEISAYSIEQKTGVSRATISKYRKREVAFENLSAGTLMKIAEGLLNDNGQSC